MYPTKPARTCSATPPDVAHHLLSKAHSLQLPVHVTDIGVQVNGSRNPGVLGRILQFSAEHRTIELHASSGDMEVLVAPDEFVVVVANDGWEVDGGASPFRSVLGILAFGAKGKAVAREFDVAGGKGEGHAYRRGG